MQRARKIKIASTILFLCFTMPIWFYLFYQILQRVQASELMMFLFWIYLPAAVIGAVFVRLLESDS
jgi:hypothetical protein